MNMTAIAIVAISCWALVEIINGGKRRKQSTFKGQEFDQMQQEIVQLKQRVETLEKIVTDEKYDLKRQIDNL